MLDPKKRLYAWSFDLVHNGHVAMAWDFTIGADSLVVWLWNNSSKAWAQPFHIVERKAALEHALLDLPADVVKKIRVDFVTWLLVDYCQKKWIKYIYKSYRNDADRRDEMTQIDYNKKINPNIETVLVKASNADNLPYVSSSGEKSLVKLQWNQTGQDTTLLVKHAMEVRLNKQYIIGMMWEIGSWKTYTWEKFVHMAHELKIPAHNIDFDTLWHNIHKKGENYQHVRDEIKKTFWDEMMNEDGSTNTRALRVVFEDPKKLQQLNAIMKDSLWAELRETMTGKTGLMIMNCAILAEHDMWALTNNNVVSVSVDRATQIARILTRENSEEKRSKAWNNFVEFTSEEALNRIARQDSLNQKNAYFIEQQAKRRYGKLVNFENNEPTPKDTKEAFRDTIEAVDTDWSLRFTGIYARLWLTGNAQELFQDIYFRYLNNNLPYHNWQHICEWLSRISRLRDKMESPNLVEIAWLFHDIVYDPKNVWNPSNEQLSAELAKDLLTKHGMKKDDVQKVYNLIMVTKHDRKCVTIDQKYICDVDLSILWAQRERYMQYATSIWIEYWFMDPKDYAQKRTKYVLDKFLNKRPFYQTQEFQHLDDQTRENIKYEKKVLWNW